MNRAALAIMFLLIISGFACAQSETKTFIGNIRLPESANNLTYEERLEYIGNRTIIVIGNDADLIERGAIELIKSSNPWLANANQTNAPADINKYLAVVLVGGPEHNPLSKIALPSMNTSMDLDYGIRIYYGQMNGIVTIIISDDQGFAKSGNLNRGLVYSPLVGLVPAGMESAAATILSLVLLAIMNILRTVFEFKTLDYGRKGKKIGDGAIIIKGINISEMGALIMASSVLGVSISWQFFGPTMEFLNYIVINSAICLMAALIHEITHRIVGKRFGIKVEYRFWKVGSGLTLLSSYLGNAFSIQGFVLEEIVEGTEKWKIGIMKLSAPIVSAICMIGFAIMFIYFQNPLLKTAYLTSSLWAMAEILPLRSLDGAYIKKWNPWIWLGAFLFIGTSYVLVVFFI
ncbi:MAG: hypothetical protein ABH983_00360 [Candidatus Micrarchaeota archaeon]|nr:hypothetical protein [Candidatus Micrarchaeota archaeon]